MAGMLVFRELRDALREGWQVYDRHEHGYLVRKFISGRWNLALVDVRQSVPPESR